MKQSKISVIIPVYNSEKYIADCVNSILSQTLLPFEIILVDDGSTDNSSNICDELANCHNNIVTIHKENGGAATARNCGLDNATGDYIIFVDADDLLHPQIIEFLFNIITEQNADLAMCNYCFFRDTMPENIEIDISRESYNVTRLCGRTLLENFTEHCGKVSLISLCMKLFRKEIFENLRIPEGFIEEDSLVLPYILERAEKIVQSKLELYYWRITPGSVTRSGFNSKSFAYIQVSFKNEQFFRNRKNRTATIYYRHQFMKRCLSFYYNIPGDRADLLEAYKPYQKLYKKCFLKFWLTTKLPIRERLAYLLFIFSKSAAKKYFKQVHGDTLL